MVATARWMFNAARARTETRGMHKHKDHPGLDPAQQRRLITRRSRTTCGCASEVTAPASIGAARRRRRRRRRSRLVSDCRGASGAISASRSAPPTCSSAFRAARRSSPAGRLPTPCFMCEAYCPVDAHSTWPRRRSGRSPWTRGSSGRPGRSGATGPRWGGAPGASRAPRRRDVPRPRRRSAGLAGRPPSRPPRFSRALTADSAHLHPSYRHTRGSRGEPFERTFPP